MDDINGVVSLSINESNIINGLNVSLIAGYKHFFTPSLGLRIYGSYDYYFFNKTPFYYPRGGAINGAIYAEYYKSSLEMTIHSIGVNMDFLYNFLSAENYDLGLFVGLGVGGNFYSLANEKSDITKARIGNTNFFDIWANIGLRSNFYKYFGVELYAKVPFLNNILYDMVDKRYGSPYWDRSWETISKTNLTIGVRAVFSY